MSAEGNKAIAGRWFTEFWGLRYNPDVIDELAAPDIRFGSLGWPRVASRTSGLRQRGRPL